MKTPENNNWSSLWHALSAAGNLSGRYLYGADSKIALNNLVEGSALYGRGQELSGRSVLLTTANQFTTASALIELDGVARRIVLCPPDLPVEHLPYVIETAEVDAIVSDRKATGMGSRRAMLFCPCTQEIERGEYDRSARHKTEWILLTSGTTGVPKLVCHTLESLAGAIAPGVTSSDTVVWSTFYDIRRYGGLQILLRAALTGKSLVLMGANESTPDFLARAGSLGVTNISGTPSQWRRALMSTSACRIHPDYVRLSGEIVDQSILNRLRIVYPQAKIVHAFASTEAGVAFEVHDEQAGFPADVIGCTPDVEMKVKDGSLRIRSARNASCYLGEQAPQLKQPDGFVDTGDIVELRNGRFHFAGRRDGMINVAGLKVYPEEIEAVLNRHPEIQMSLVKTRKNSITGEVITADVVLRNDSESADRDAAELQKDILLFCRGSLSSYKIPAGINFVSSLNVAESGKILRNDA